MRAHSAELSPPSNGYSALLRGRLRLRSISDSRSIAVPAALCSNVSPRPFRADGDLGLTALTATLFCGSYLFGILIADVRPRLFARRAALGRVEARALPCLRAPHSRNAISMPRG